MIKSDILYEGGTLVLTGKKMKLKDFAQVIVGGNYSSSTCASGGIPMIGVAEIWKCVSPSKFVRPDDINDFRKMLKVGDVLIPRADTKFFLYHFVNENNIPSVAGNGLIILRALEGRNQEFSSAFGSDSNMIVFSKEIKNLYKGGKNKLLSPKALKEVEVSIESKKYSIPSIYVQPNEFVIQNSNNEGISYAEIVKRINCLFEGSIKTLNVYVKSDEGKAYFVVDGNKTGSIDLFCL